jgi:hypothetical protein
MRGALKVLIGAKAIKNHKGVTIVSNPSSDLHYILVMYKDGSVGKVSVSSLKDIKLAEVDNEI